MTNKTSRNYCFTSYKVDTFREVEDPRIRYCIWGEEICPETGRPHIQGYLELNTALRMAAIKKIFNDNELHLEVKRGSRDQARAYCMKDDKFHEWGIWLETGQGERNDLKKLYALCKKQEKNPDIMNEEPVAYMKYYKAVDRVKQDMQPKRKEPPYVIYLWGESGSGKTRTAWEASGGEAYIKPSETKWWDGYNNEQYVIIDDYYGSPQLPPEYLLKLLDRYPMRVEVKGGSMEFNSPNIFITSNVPPQQTMGVHWGAMKRRINEIRHIDTTQSGWGNTDPATGEEPVWNQITY